MKCYCTADRASAAVLATLHGTRCRPETTDRVIAETIVCPKCDISVDRDARECPRCGVVFAKYRRHALTAESSISAPAAIVPVRDAEVDRVWWGRFALILALGWWTWGFARAPFDQTLMDTVWHLPDLVFHEAGHVLFMPFGPFITSLGGSLFQCALPVALACAFWRQDNVFATLVCVWWTGQNLVDVAPYIADARSLRLVLLGGRTGAEVEGHDWEYILTQLGLLHRDRALGLWTYRIGMLTMATALLGAGWVLCQVRTSGKS